MIFVHDKGRMANNILQYGHVYAWGREHNRPTMSMRFAYKYPYFHICHTRHHNFATYAFAKYAAKLHLIPTVHFDEPDGDTSPQERVMMNRRMVMVTGWEAHWYDLFLKYKADIIQLFTFVAAVENAVAPHLKAADGKLRLGVHIRRGDYQRFQGGRFFYTDEQYIQLVRSFAEHCADQPLQVYICGNDPALDKQKFITSLPEHQVCFPEGNPGEDLCLFSHCDWLIGPPSTFTLVAAMYRDVPLYWVQNTEQPVEPSCFGHFNELFRQII